MASTFINFTPSTTAVFSFQAQLAGTQYTVIVTWNIFGQRYYVNVNDLSGNLIVCRPLIACGPQLQAAFEWANGYAIATTTQPHNVPLGSSANVTISQTDSGFDGEVQAVSTGPNTLAYQLSSDPGEATPINGAVNFNLNLIAGNIADAYLLFRYETQQFEYGP